MNHTLYERAKGHFPGGVNSPVRSFSGLGVDPLIATSGKADEIIDANGRRYIDFCQSWGALLHGHAHPAIVSAVNRQMACGSTFGLTTLAEIELAESIKARMPFIEKIRFVSSGTEATMSALRLARAVTDRPTVIKFEGHYHGHADPFLVKAGSALAHLSLPLSKGVNLETVRFTLNLPFNDENAVLEAFSAHPGQIAAIIVEPIAANMGVVLPKAGFLSFLRQVTAENGTLLIFDEVITGFRIAAGGAASHFGITPDLVCLGKIMGGGFPAAAFGGKGKIMDELAPVGSVFQAGTLSGNPVAMAAGIAALALTDTPHFYNKLKEKTDLITQPLLDQIQKKSLPVTLNQAGSLFTLFFGVKKVENFEEAKKSDQQIFRRLFSFLLDRGIYFSPSPFEAHFSSSVHTEEHLHQVREALLDFFKAEFLS